MYQVEIKYTEDTFGLIMLWLGDNMDQNAWTASWSSHLGTADVYEFVNEEDAVLFKLAFFK